MASDVLYLSFDGVLQPLTFSQVVRVVAGLSRRGIRYHLLSIEQAADLDEGELRGAARTITDSVVDCARLRVARESTAPHFSLDSGLDRYDRVLRSCLQECAGEDRESAAARPASGSALGANGIESVH
jgi:hypothetical protein